MYQNFLMFFRNWEVLFIMQNRKTWLIQEAWKKEEKIRQKKTRKRQ